MKKINLKKLTLTAIFAAIAVVGSLFSVPVFGSKCAPIQHMVNILCAIFLGPGYGLAAAFISSTIRNMLGLGTLLAFPGSMCGAFLSGILYRCLKKRWLAYAGELVGTSLLGGLLAFPIAYFILGNTAVALFTFVVPFLISTGGGTICAIVLVEIMAKAKLLSRLQSQLEEDKDGKSRVHNPDGCC